MKKTALFNSTLLFAGSRRIYKQFASSLLVFGIGIFLLLCFQPLAAKPFQTEHAIKGKVTDEKGTPMAGASVNIKGTTVGATTGADGLFALTAGKPDAVLIITYIGYTTAEVKVNSSATLSIALKREDASLANVVVVGYGTQKKVNLTGAVDQVSGDVLENRPVTNVTRGLQGVLPNLNIRITDGKPIRAVCKVTLRELKPEELRVIEEANQSPDLTHYRVAKKGDTLPLMCYRIYGDSKYYWQVAKANKLSNFRLVQPGQEIFFPPIAKT